MNYVRQNMRSWSAHSWMRLCPKFSDKTNWFKSLVIGMVETSMVRILIDSSHLVSTNLNQIPKQKKHIRQFEQTWIQYDPMMFSRLGQQSPPLPRDQINNFRPPPARSPTSLSGEKNIDWLVIEPPLWRILVGWDYDSRYMEQIQDCSEPPTRKKCLL